MKKIAGYCILVIALLTECKKYPEDEHLSFHSVRHRLTEHDWYFSKFVINDIDSTLNHLNYTTTFPTNDPRVLHVKIKPFAYGTNGSEIVMYQFSDFLFSTQFSLRKRKKDVFIFTNNNFNNPNKPFFGVGDNNSEWIIRKLTKGDFIIEREFNNVKYRLEFKG